MGRTLQRTLLKESSHGPLFTRAKSARETLIEQMAELDEQMADLFLEDGTLAVSGAMLKEALRRITLGNKGCAVLCGSAFRNKGIQPLLNAIVDYLPSPSDRPPLKGTSRSGDHVTRRPGSSDPLCALAFKVMHDKQRGAMVYVRVYSGTLLDKAMLLNVNRGIKERVGRVVQVLADRVTEMGSISAGNIGALIGLKETRTGDTLVAASDTSPIELQGVVVPEPVFVCGVEAERITEQAQLEIALKALQREDPSFHVSVQSETGQTLVSGMGELHLDIIRDRLVREWNLHLRMGKLRIAYRETVGAAWEEECLLDRVIAGRRMQARLIMSVAPRSRGEGNLIEVQGLPTPRTISPVLAAKAENISNAIRGGVEAGLARGPLASYAVQDVHVCVSGLEGISLPDADPIAYRACVAQSLSGVLDKASPQLLEPIMRVEVTVLENVGGVLADLTNARRGQILSLDSSSKHTVIEATAPSAEMIGYSTAIRSLTQGTGTFSMELLRYDPVPSTLQEDILVQIRGF